MNEPLAMYPLIGMLKSMMSAEGERNGEEILRVLDLALKNAMHSEDKLALIAALTAAAGALWRGGSGVAFSHLCSLQSAEAGKCRGSLQ